MAKKHFPAEEKIIGSSLKNLKEMVKEFASSGDNVLFLGGRGTGKELFAELYQQATLRDKDKFISLNCSGVSDEILQSELFGHVEGAYTGATKYRQGLIDTYGKEGVIFLDELGEASPSFQANLLRLLQTGDYKKLGSDKKEFLDPNAQRIIAATSKEDKVREDLKDRFVPLYIMELAARRNDISELIMRFCAASKVKHITKDAFEFLTSYEWPGNVRQLQRVIEKEAIMLSKKRSNNTITLYDFPSIKFSLEEKVDKSTRLNINELPLNNEVYPARYFLRYLYAPRPKEKEPIDVIRHGEIRARLNFLEYINNTLRGISRNLAGTSFPEGNNIPLFENTTPKKWSKLFWEHYAKIEMRPTDIAKRFPGETGMSPKNATKELNKAKVRLKQKDKKERK